MFTENSPKRNYYEFLSSLTSKPAISLLQETHDSYFPMTFEKILRNTVLYQNTGKGTERTETFGFQSENFHKVHPKETVVKSFIS